MSEDVWTSYLLIAPDSPTDDPAPWCLVDEWLVSPGQQVKGEEEVVRLRYGEAFRSVHARRDGFLYSIFVPIGRGGPPGVLLGILTNWPHAPPGWRSRYGP